MRKFSGLLKAAALVAISGIVYLGARYLTVQTVRCRVDDSACPPDVFAELSRNYGQSVYSVRPVEIEAKLLKADFRLESVEVGLKFPLTLEAKLKTRVPVIQIIPSKTWKQGLLADGKGRIIGERETGGLPLIVWAGAGEFSPGKDLPEDFVGAIPLLSEIYALFSPDSLEISGKDIVFNLSGKTKVTVPAANGRDKLEVLQLLINQARIGNQPAPKEIDLRFNYPVIKN